MAEVVLEIVALGFEHVEALVLDLPAGAATSGEVGNIVRGDGQRGDPGILVGDLAGAIDDLERQPVDDERVLAVTDRDALEPAIAVGLKTAPLLDPLLAARRRDPSGS